MIAKFEKIPFHGDQLVAVRHEDKIFTSIRRVCRCIGLSFRSQLRKLENSSWAGVVILTTPDRQGKPQPHAMIDIESLPIWMATINARKVAEEVRPKIELFQREAKKVLADHFLGNLGYDASDQLSVVLAGLLHTRKEVLSLLREQEASRLAIEVASAKADRAIMVADAVEASYSGRTGFKTALGFAKTKGLSIQKRHLAVIGKTLSKYCRDNRIFPDRVEDERYGGVKSYPLEVLEKHEEIFRRYAVGKMATAS